MDGNNNGLPQEHRKPDPVNTLLIFITQILILVFLKALSFGNKLLIFASNLSEYFRKNKSQYNGFYSDASIFHAHLIRRLPYFLFKADVGCIHRCH